MTKIKKLFGGLTMTWKDVLLFAFCAGVYTGLINQVPFLKNTSFTDIAVSYEDWILFDFIIGVNCHRPLEAACKVFVFFLISQSVCFLVEIPMIGMNQALLYFKSWFVQILLTFPGGFVVYYAKKDNWLGALVTTMGAVMEAFFLAEYGSSVLHSFPGHLLTTICCILVILCFLFFLIKKPLFRWLSLAAVILVSGYVGMHDANMMYSYSGSLPGKYTSYQLKVNDGSYIDLENNGQSYTYYFYPYTVKENTITFTNDAGSSITYQVVVSNHMVDVVSQ